jgi:c-di-GMP-binding flagellar brake protein YcgR
MLLIAGIVFLILLCATLMMLWAHEKISIKRVVPRAKVEEFWDGEERRSHKRFNKTLELEYFVQVKPEQKKLRTVDVSRGGIKLLLDEKLPKGTILCLKIYIPEKRQTVEVDTEVVWTDNADKRDDSGKRFFFSGLKFISVKEPSGVHLSEYLTRLESEG